MSGSLTEVEQALGQLEALAVVVEELRRTAAGVDGLSGSLQDVNGGLDEVVDVLGRVVDLLVEVEGHVEDLDRKTGPFVPPTDESS